MSPYFFLNRAAVGRVNVMFALPASGKEQDWEVEMASAARRSELFRALVSDALAQDADMEAAVAALFIASADDAIGAGRFSNEEDATFSRDRNCASRCRDSGFRRASRFTPSR